MDNVIKFPTTPEKEFYNQTKVAREAASQMISTQEFLNYRLKFSCWKEYSLTETDVENVALYGEHMNLKPIIAVRLAAKLAEVLCKIKYSDPLDDYY